MIVKIYGERNTGTNYLEQLLKKNLLNLPEEKQANISIMPSPSLLLPKNELDKQDLAQLGWKHRFIDVAFLRKCGFEKKSGLILTLTKNPYSWLMSLHKRPYAPIHLRNRVIAFDEQGMPNPHSVRNIKIIRQLRKCGRLGERFLACFPQWSEYEKIEFKDFIRVKWFTQFNECHDKPFKNPVKLWNVKNKAYIELAQYYDVLSITYEALLASPEAVVRNIMTRLGCELKNFENMQHAAKKEDSEKNHEYYQDYYLQEKWRERLTENEIKWISSQLDPLVMKSFGYQLL